MRNKHYFPENCLYGNQICGLFVSAAAAVAILLNELKVDENIDVLYKTVHTHTRKHIDDTFEAYCKIGINVAASGDKWNESSTFYFG